MLISTSLWRYGVPVLLAGGLLAAPVGLDLQQGLLLTTAKVYARGSGSGGGGGPGHDPGGRGNSGASAASASSSTSASSSSSSGSSDASGGHGTGDRGVADSDAPGAGGGQDVADARERYNRALATKAQLSVAASAGPGQGLVSSEATVVISSETGEAVYVFGDEATEALIRAGWAAPQARADRAFASQDQKVRTYVAIAKALGHSPYIGAMQANFGRDGSGRGPAGDWREVNLDVNGDGTVDEQDLKDARQSGVMR